MDSYQIHKEEKCQNQLEMLYHLKLLYMEERYLRMQRKLKKKKEKKSTEKKPEKEKNNNKN